MLTGFRKVNDPQEALLMRLQDNVELSLNQIIGNRILDGIILEDITLVEDSVNKIEHKLSRDLKGWIVIRDELAEGNSEWTAFTPTGSWTSNTTYSGFYRRVGDSIEVITRVLLSGAPAASTLTLTIPLGLTIDTSKLTPQVTSDLPYGTTIILDSGTTNYFGTLTYNSTTSLLARVLSDNGTATRYVSVTNAAPMTFTNLDEVQVRYSVPIVGWDSRRGIWDTQSTNNLKNRFLFLSTDQARKVSLYVF